MSPVYSNSAGPGPEPEVTTTHGTHGFSAAQPERRLLQTGEQPAEPLPPATASASEPLDGVGVCVCVCARSQVNTRDGRLLEEELAELQQAEEENRFCLSQERHRCVFLR